MKYILLSLFLISCGGKALPPLSSKECNELLNLVDDVKYRKGMLSRKDLLCEKATMKCVVFCENTCDKECVQASLETFEYCTAAGLITE